MDPRANYRTKQREMLIGYLKTVPGVHITASDVCEYFRTHGAPISQATVYRQLEKLVGEGVLNKYIIDAGSPACFEYVSADSHSGGEVCFHCKCEKCGKLIHMHCEELEEIQAHLSAEHHFKLDPMRTVFYGLCEECRI
ncbi:MAG: transcriptional repressor [Firmicutes bacterium]|nr:transcriptional repressor [Bacillota bacterium]